MIRLASPPPHDPRGHGFRRLVVSRWRTRDPARRSKAASPEAPLSSCLGERVCKPWTTRQPVGAQLYKRAGTFKGKDMQAVDCEEAGRCSTV